MLSKLKKSKSNSEGFTIIEVMIVLAIAGLILLIVFLAVPALQRGSRNTQRKNEASQVLSSVANYVSNTNGTVPSSTATLTTAAQDAKFNFYTSTNLYFGATTTIPTTAVVGGNGNATTLTTEDLIFFSGATCSGTTATTTSASSRSYALIYAVESGGNAVPQCIGS